MFRKVMLVLAATVVLIMPSFSYSADFSFDQFYAPTVAAPADTLLPGQPVTVPTDFLIWGGVSISGLFTFLVMLLKRFKVIEEGSPVKKSIGVYLAILGALIGGGFAYSQDLTPFMVFTMLAGGGYAGFASVGFHSTAKNFKERK